jgi:hypothetical protein
MTRGLAFLAVALIALSAHAADLDGVSLPDIRTVNGTPLRLNGIGLRTFSILGVHIYVAGLYLEQRSENPDAILQSPGVKLIDMRFLRDVPANDARDAWMDGFNQNCRAPCSLDPLEVHRFLSAVPPVHQGDSAALLFTEGRLQITFNGRLMGDITDRHFATVILTTFIGPVPPTPRLKRELLGMRD